jgi:hypothetical protein
MSLPSVATLRPGYLVAVKTSVKGNVTYSKQDLEFLKLDDGASKTKWETERHIKDEAEQERASEVRAKARSLIASICSTTDFGYLCPVTRKADLDDAAKQARQLVADFNATSRVTRVKFQFFTGYVADNDESAVKAINEEVRGLLDEMREGLENLDVDRVRLAAGKATQLGQMLAPDAEVRIQLAVKSVRDNATRIAKAVKSGEQAAIVIERAALTRIAEARTAFLDIDMEEREIAQPTVSGRAIDLEPEGEEQAKLASPARELEVG